MTPTAISREGYTFDESAVPSQPSLRIAYVTETRTIGIEQPFRNDDAYLRSSAKNAKRLDDAMDEVFGD